MSPFRLVTAGVTALVLFWPISSSAGPVNVTFDDADPAINYIGPEGAWNSSSVVCPACINPPTSMAQRHTFHKGAFVAGGMLIDDDDDGGEDDDDDSITILGDGSIETKADFAKGTSDSPLPKATSTVKDDGGGKDHGHNSTNDKGKGTGSRRRARSVGVEPHTLRRSSTQSPVSAEFRFNGTGVYVFCIQPLGAPSLVNTTFFVDGTELHTFIHQGSTTQSYYVFAANITAFAHTGLDDGPHVLTLILAPSSIFILDSVVVTQNKADTLDASSILASKPTPSRASLSTEPKDKSGKASFAGVLGGILGVLGTLAFGTAFSLYCRRRRAAARDRRDRETMPQLSTVETREFVPRFFSGTYAPVLVSTNSTPPPYQPSASSQSQSQLSSTDGQTAATVTTYADIPPPLEELDAAPPTFGEAIVSSPVVVVIPAGTIPVQVAAEEDQTS
ncbi:hypothetical protein MIND_00218100 [Mycena indigotica]|uniref:Transmembrane protein n=1 Tax=Mycena indigotica TaxID=2126181 RepID=A0A8H6T6Z8_9AGAR|nr:uncharacterized protein MIND_00218100 [Mycena indigotica]KAF7312060.1 hypothetical protein MIND_00218100 [Mycena indigotica]